MGLCGRFDRGRLESAGAAPFEDRLHARGDSLHVLDRFALFLSAQEEESLAHQIKCFEGTPQASQIKLVADKVGSEKGCEGEKSTREGEHRKPGGSAGELVVDEAHSRP